MVKRLILIAVVLATLVATPVYANVTYSFYCITNNSLLDAGIGEAQLSVEVSDPGSNQVLFTFANVGSSYCRIAEVYFDDGFLLGIAGLIDADQGIGGDPYVDFTEGSGSPGDLPGGNVIGFTVTAGFLADSDSGPDNVVPPPYKSGVEPGQSLGIVFNLQSGAVFDDVITDLNSGALNIGIHVQGFDGDGSESFVTYIPAPGAIVLAAMGIGLVGWLKRRRIL